MLKLTALLLSSLFLAACTPSMSTSSTLQQAPIDALLKRTWQVVALDGKPVRAQDYQLQIDDDGRLSAYFGCNRILGTLKQAHDGEFQLIENVASTRMLCRHDDEQQGIKALQSAVRYDVVTRKAPFEQLMLRDATGKVRLEALFQIF
ncbi:META domain-containing protein [Pasteurellaceae bacterium HPA106]|uniref:META domain-containing protein n=1 Tax=Spirabiliibacterium pneumoniae TaxID=221400 RepID=UPI001AAC8C74|nr:META domain-containing protein [Spirabiliibacterium pneumoniae]MBE2896508.1 META domain-containing protein [Spirabiliibacterium pneumoniae]